MSICLRKCPCREYPSARVSASRVSVCASVRVMSIRLREFLYTQVSAARVSIGASGLSVQMSAQVTTRLSEGVVMRLSA